MPIRVLRSIAAPEPEGPPKAIEVNAMIDTGASASAIRVGLAQQLNLLPIDRRPFVTASGESVCDVYFVRLLFPGELSYEGRVLELPTIDKQGIDCLIGRDVLAQAVLVYLGHTNSFSVSF